LEAYNELAAVNDPFELVYIVRRDGRDEIEISDVKRKRKFLSRVHYPALRLEEIHVGGKITIYSRQYRVVDFADEVTRSGLGRAKDKVFALLTPSALRSQTAIGAVWAAVERAGLRITNARMIRLDARDAATVASGCDGVSADALVDEQVLALELLGEDTGARWADLCGHLADGGICPAGSAVAASTPAHDERLRGAVFGTGPERLASSRDTAGSMGECTCVIVLPTAVLRGQAGPILEDLTKAVAEGGAAAGGGDGRLRVGALVMHDFDRRCAEEFLEVYRLVVPDFVVRPERGGAGWGGGGGVGCRSAPAPAITPAATLLRARCCCTMPPCAQDYAAELASGPCVALEVSGPGAVARVREIVGPRDVDAAKRIRCVAGELSCLP